MYRFYFTYGNDGSHPFVGGWTVVEAPSREIAIATFRAFHPDKYEGIVNCCSIYIEQEFVLTQMFTMGNFGTGAHEYIGVSHKLIERK